MDSDDYFSDFDPNMLDEVDAIEAAALQAGPSSAPPPKPTASSNGDSDFDDITFDIDASELEKLDHDIEVQYQSQIPAPRTVVRSNSRNTVQTTLFGGRLPPQASTSKSPTATRQMQRTSSNRHTPLFGSKPNKTKMWDHTEFAKTGLKRGASKGKGKGKEKEPVEEEHEEEVFEFDEFPAPFVPSKISRGLLSKYLADSLKPPPPMKLQLDPQEIQTWIYPLNHPKRDYQYNIVKNCFFDNTLVCLPTGLGKTFIAGVVMLNFYRWFPEGKIVFVAPTKPLVAQQIDACHHTCGIPGNEAAELTGGVPKPARSRAWHYKRVFYMTPQTLVNDLVNELCDARDIVLLVIDEAHRGTGDYAYAQLIRYMMSKNPHFRVLALSATPGGTPEVVQSVVDALHISRIEARDENSLDLKPYLHQKDIKQHIVSMNPGIDKIKNLLLNVMQPILASVQQFMGSHVDLERMNPYRAQAIISNGTLGPGSKWAIGPLSKLAALARAMGYLIEGTVGMCYSSLLDMSTDKEGGGDKQSKAKQQLSKKPEFQALMKELELQRSDGTFALHPKLDLLKNLLIQHLGQRLPDPNAEQSPETKVIIFVHYREAVDEIIAALNLEQPLIRATRFIGQGTDKKGGKGMTQKEQLNIIQQFKKDVYNVLVATSIGEEGLDIGEVDLIVCYDSQKSSVRMLQRIGRTGRKRDGHVHVLLAEYREELNFEKAKDSHKHVLKSIWKGVDYELYGDVGRLLPQDAKPSCIEKVMEIKPYDRSSAEQAASKPARSPTRGTKRKRNDDIRRNMPEGASSGFQSVAEMMKNKRKRLKPMTESDIEAAATDDEDDLALEAGFSAPLQRAHTDVPTGSKKPAKSSLRKTKTTTVDSKKPPRKPRSKKALAPPNSQQLKTLGEDDEDDMAIERGWQRERSSSPDDVPLSARLHQNKRRASISPAASHDSLDFSPARASPLVSRQSEFEAGSPQFQDVDVGFLDDLQDSLSPPNKRDDSMAWLVADDDDEPDIEILSSSPIAHRRKPQTAVSFDSSVVVVDDCLPPPSTHRSQARTGKSTQGRSSASASDASVLDLCSSPQHQTPDDPQEDLEPPPSFPVARRGKRKVVTIVETSSPCVDTSPPVLRRLRRQRSPSPTADLLDDSMLDSPEVAPRPAARRKRPVSRIHRGEFLAGEALHSGDEVSEGESNADEDVENSSDREFVTEASATQAQPDYSQSRIYRESLMTQAPRGWGSGEAGAGPAFQRGVVKRGAFGVRGPGVDQRQARYAAGSSSPPHPDSELDDYEMGSFVVPDDEFTQAY